MSVRLVTITKPEDDMSVDEFLAFVARVSNPENQMNTETAPKLIKYLVKNKHWSPLEMVSLTMEIKTTRDISRQILRHRSFSFQEFSQRYAKATNLVTNREARLQDKKNRQNSIKVDDEELQEWFENMQHVVASNIRNFYEEALDRGIAKEQARVILPEGLTETTLYMSGSLRSWVHYCQLRMSNGTQAEHSDIAKDAWSIICDKFPSLTDIFKEKE